MARSKGSTPRSGGLFLICPQSKFRPGGVEGIYLADFRLQREISHIAEDSTMDKKRNLNELLKEVLGNALGQLLYDFIKRWIIWFPGSLLAALAKFLAANQTIAIVVLLASFIIPILIIAYSYAQPRFTLSYKQQPGPITPLGRYLILDFTGASVSDYDVVGSPYGVIWTTGVPFRILPYIEGNILKGHAIVRVGPKHDGSPNRNTVVCEVHNVKKIYILWTAGNGWKSYQNVQFEGRNIGRLELTFSDRSTQAIPVVLGKNIREWTYQTPSPQGQGVVDTLSDTSVTQVWHSLENLHTLDMIKIDVENPPKDLKTIELIGQFELSTNIPGESLPHFQISAITCETM